MADAVLTLNAGSSSLKFAVYFRTGGALAVHRKGQIEGIGSAPHLVIRDEGGAVLAEQRWPEQAGQNHETFLAALLKQLEGSLGPGDRLVGAGHRIVHGGDRFTSPVRVTPEVLDQLQALVPLAPLHQPHNIAPIRALQSLRPGLAQIACFDTAFHHGMPALAKTVAIPRAVAARHGIRRFGFHGLSYEYLAGELGKVAPALSRGRVILAHLGSGASLCAIRDGRSVDTTMSFTALDGLVMGTRCGSIDPGIILFLMREGGLSVDAVETLLYTQSGLLGLSDGRASDMRTLQASADPRDTEAVALFCDRVASGIAGLIVSLGGLDGIVFSAGIGEHDAEVRARVAAQLAWLGLRLDAARNRDGEGRISTGDSQIEVLVIPTDEEAMLARHVGEVLDGQV